MIIADAKACRGGGISDVETQGEFAIRVDELFGNDGLPTGFARICELPFADTLVVGVNLDDLCGQLRKMDEGTHSGIKAQVMFGRGEG